MALSAGTRLGPFEILSVLGAGGMGEVYRARDTKLGRDVALKVLPEAFAHDAERMTRLEREAHVLASLNHPNIATIHGLEETNDIRALVMELVEGPTLAERIMAGAMTLDEALPIAKQIAEGLEYAHERSIIHRDLKPANIKLTADGNVKLLDFGLAKAVEGATLAGNTSISSTLTLEETRAGVILGTAAYMSPEQARGKTVDKRADIWAFGVVLYEMLTGKRPFMGATVSDTLTAVLTGEPAWEAVPVGMRRLVQRCLEKDAHRRLRDIGEARLAIEEQMDGRGSSLELAPHATKRAVFGRIAAGVMAVALVVSLLLFWRTTRPMSQRPIWFGVNLGPEFEANELGSSVVLSPEGTRLVYTGRDTDNKVRLYTRQLEQKQASPLMGTEGAYAPFFSPDGQFIGFFAGGKLKKISVQGGGIVVLCDAAQGFGGSWSEDGSIIAALNFSTGLSRVPAADGSVQLVTELNPAKRDAAHRWPQVLPGAHAVLFTAETTTGAFDEASVEVQSLKTRERKTLVRQGYFGRYVASGHLLYVWQGVLYAAPMNVKRLELSGPATPVLEEVSSNPTSGFADVDVTPSGALVYVKAKAARKKLVWLESTGRTQSLRPGEAEYLPIPRFSPDGKRLALGMVTMGNTDVWVYEWQRDIMTRLTFTPGLDSWPVWSPDGKHIVFTSTRHGGLGNLYWMRADGAGAEEAIRLTESKNFQVPYSFSPDGKRLAFTELEPQTSYDLWTLPLDNVESDHPKAGKPEPFLQTKFNEIAPNISPDGRWLAYHSDETGNWEVYVRRFPGPGGKWQVSTGGGLTPIWSKKGRELFYGSGQGMMVASYSSNDETFLAAKPRLWAQKDDLGWMFDLEPNDKRFIVLQTTDSFVSPRFPREHRGPAEVAIMLNFFDELRRQAPARGKYDPFDEPRGHP
jgi:WD40 repeat protein